VRVVDVGKLRRKAGDGGEHVQGEEHALVLAQRPDLPQVEQCGRLGRTRLGLGVKQRR
jgi:hypothetical protein